MQQRGKTSLHGTTKAQHLGQERGGANSPSLAGVGVRVLEHKTVFQTDDRFEHLEFSVDHVNTDVAHANADIAPFQKTKIQS